MRRVGLTHQVLKTALGAGLAWALAARVSPNAFPYFAPLAVILTLQATVADTMAKALYRVAGVVGGVIVAGFIGHWLPAGPLSVGLTTLLGLSISTALRLNPAITSQVGVSGLLVLAARDSHYAVYRVVETALGAVVAIAINAVIVPPNEIPQAERCILGLADLLSGKLADLPEGLDDAPGRNPVQPLSRAIMAGISTAQRALQLAETSGKFNPFLRVRATRLKKLSLAVGELEKVAIQVRGVARGLADLRAAGERRHEGLKRALQDTADCIAVFGRAVVTPSGETFQRLAAAGERARASQSDCLSRLRETATLAELRDLGAILTDLNRILTELDADRWIGDGVQTTPNVTPASGIGEPETL